MTMFHPITSERMTPWKSMVFAVKQWRFTPGSSRLSGPWPRLSVFTATAPDAEAKLWLSRTKTAHATAPLPSVDIDNTPVDYLPQECTPAGDPMPPPRGLTHVMYGGPGNSNSTNFWATTLGGTGP